EVGGSIDSAGVVMHGDAVGQVATKRVEHATRPRHVIAIRATCDQEWLGAAKLADINTKFAVKIGVVLGPHVAAASPAFIPNAPVTDAERFRRAVPGALFGQRTVRRIIAILYPFPQFAWRATTDVAGEIGFCADQPTQTNKL